MKNHEDIGRWTFVQVHRAAEAGICTCCIVQTSNNGWHPLEGEGLIENITACLGTFWLPMHEPTYLREDNTVYITRSGESTSIDSETVNGCKNYKLVYFPIHNLAKP
jgi:hypothetical protein